MDLENLMQSLSLNVSDQSTRNFNVTGLKIGENHTDIVFGEFVNKHMIVATQYGNIGSLLKVTVDDVLNGSINEPVYTVQVVFGCVNDEQQAAARFIAESLKIRKPLMLFLCLKDYQISTVNTLVQALLNYTNV
ncbi:hypothetical protein RN001_014495 [Aquatica leii]|uniref:Proteasome assembly chaperone 3 n=1 Tax=Aquatica leii TaxID=1421715 RepID=A0AAN7P207_9COLE|nr:hypothetical protein RN001_014495 [Aquatica leii]